MTFYRTRIIKGRPYLYEETRWREGGKVRSRSRIVRPGKSGVGGHPIFNIDWGATLRGAEPNYGVASAEKAAEKLKEEIAAKAAAPSALPPAPEPPAEQSPNGEQAKAS